MPSSCLADHRPAPVEPSRSRPGAVRRLRRSLDPLESRAGRGFTLLELTVALALLSLLLGLGAPLWRGTVDHWAVRTVRDRVAAGVHRARLEGRLRGGSRFELDAAAGRLSLHGTAPDSLLWEDESPREHRVRLVLPRGADQTRLRFDALGLGVVASHTLVFRRGDAEARLVVSSRGRVSRP